MSRKIIGSAEIRERTDLSRTTVWRMERAGEFPARRQISKNRVGWLEDEVDAWIEAQLRVTAAENKGRNERGNEF